MKNVNQFINNIKGLKTFKGAHKRLEKFIAAHDITYIIAQNDKSEYVPVVFINHRTEWLAGHLAFSGIVVVN